MDRNMVTISKFLSKHLRHTPEELGLTLQPGGWVSVENGTYFTRNYGLPQKFCYTKQLTSAARVAGGFGPWMVADILLWMCAFVQ